MRVSRNGGGHPRWRHDGRELYYVDGESLLAVPVGVAPAIATGTPVRLFAAAMAVTDMIAYEPASDGRFLMLENRTADAYPIKLTLNFAQASV